MLAVTTGVRASYSNFPALSLSIKSASTGNPSSAVLVGILGRHNATIFLFGTVEEDTVSLWIWLWVSGIRMAPVSKYWYSSEKNFWV